MEGACRRLEREIPDILRQPPGEETGQGGNDQDVPVRVGVVSLEVVKDVEYGSGQPDPFQEGQDGRILVRFPEDVPIHVLMHIHGEVPPDGSVFQEGDVPAGVIPRRTGKPPKKIVGQDRACGQQFPPFCRGNGEPERKVLHGRSPEVSGNTASGPGRNFTAADASDLLPNSNGTHFPIQEKSVSVTFGRTGITGAAGGITEEKRKAFRRQAKESLSSNGGCQEVRRRELGSPLNCPAKVSVRGRYSYRSPHCNRLPPWSPRRSSPRRGPPSPGGSERG